MRSSNPTTPVIDAGAKPSGNFGLLVALIKIEALLFLAATALVVLHRLVAGNIDLGEVQLHRLQFLFASLGFAAWYLGSVTASAGDGSLPDPGPAVLSGFGASRLLYLVNKLHGLWPQLTNSSGVR